MLVRVSLHITACHMQTHLWHVLTSDSTDHRNKTKPGAAALQLPNTVKEHARQCAILKGYLAGHRSPIPSRVAAAPALDLYTTSDSQPRFHSLASHAVPCLMHALGCSVSLHFQTMRSMRCVKHYSAGSTQTQDRG